jgi:hypothetical protein
MGTRKTAMRKLPDALGNLSGGFGDGELEQPNERREDFPSATAPTS